MLYVCTCCRVEFDSHLGLAVVTLTLSKSLDLHCEYLAIPGLCGVAHVYACMCVLHVHMCVVLYIVTWVHEMHGQVHPN